ncbi:SAM-dependent methyltransferase [Saccharopolyspora rosea]|uniref:SAM-dependent methyltransferase n=1 Tax=Saccharopolyspora rosea TaxID=524884 RepID=A0ABW3G0C7_9PSEU
MVDIRGDVDLESPNAARMYDYYLGGKAHLSVDQEAAERQLAVIPSTREWARANRSFLRRAVRYLAGQGIDQFLDLGSGIPTVGNVHEVAHELNPRARVAYVDFEPVAVAHARYLLGDDPRVTVTQADIRDPQQVLAAPGVAGLLDFTRPVGVLAVAILHFVADSDDPAGVVAGYRDACVPGSHLAVSHLSRVTFTDEQLAHGHAIYSRTSTPGTLRSREEIAALLTGYQLVDPGLVLLPQWRPEEPVDDALAASTNSYAGVGALLPG